MSWMDSWSRPTKSQATPAPFYLIPGSEDTPYCRSCGRVISSRKSTETKGSSTPAKYCSSRCRSQKPGALDRRIESAFVKFLTGEEELPEAKVGKTEKKGEKKGGKKGKGDPRVLVPVDVVERYVFRHDAEGQEEQDAAAKSVDGSVDGSVEDHEGNSKASGSVRSTDDVDDHLLDAASQTDGHRVAALAVRSGTRIRPSQEVSEVNGSVGGEKGRAERQAETKEAMEKRLEGQRRTKEKEMVRSAARRGVVFGFVVGEGKEEKRKCEAVMNGIVVEPSFAKGDWSIRWRD
ncbi:Chitinase [Coniochaeta hoffmannii]|uniref:Chitinase n=1 Tax=Coniochaeta hoffmannii TaxID=91930 RepID=A0AA38W0E6_9PEZI|nr:Chitinase [Coniochaeta hoffmannii]